ncbi:MAG TPA: MaoC/PaaZ C-terminal domain-containing protein [Acidimicrobiales bacterium]|jgi:acyl dehydratase|nr:MaoC/PaaZ C-terminal domain-containing protein [Acidimicrobiales bacterium]
MLDVEAVGRQSEPLRRSWDDRDAIIYALGVGAGSTDPTGFELEYTTENTAGRSQKVLPTFATVVGQNAIKMSVLGEIDFTKMVHGDQTITLHGEIPVRGTAEVTTTVAGIYDKGSGGLVVLESSATNVDTSTLLLTTRMGLFVRGAGGFGGPRGPESDEEDDFAAQSLPEREADHVVRYATRTDQALLYRLSGDRNRLHSDPSFAKKAGFDRPILHGLCTYGFSGRALLHEVCGSDSAAFGSMRARFSRPTLPGDELTISIWDVTSEARGAYRFRTENQRGDVVVDGGLFRTSTSN